MAMIDKMKEFVL
jgi:hypothetical protein